MQGKVAPKQSIHICSPTMCELIQSAANPWQTDTVEGVVDAQFFKGQMNITMTSTWDNNQQSQVPLLFSILFDKSAKSYRQHFKVLFKLYARAHQYNDKEETPWTKVLATARKTIEDFLEHFPGA